MSKSPGLEGLFAKFALGTCYYSCSQGDLHKPTFDRCYSFVRGGRGNLVPMFTPRPAHFVAFFIALAVAGCAITGDQPAQNSTGAAPSRPKTVLVYDLEFSPDIAVVDREFTVRLAREMGDISVSNQIVAKRVNAEIVATIITILRYEAGLNVRPGIDDDPALKNTALVVVGRLQPANRGARAQGTTVNFNGDVAAEITVSRASEDTKTELLNFTVQAQKGAAFTGPHAAAQNAAIKAVLASESVPTQNLSSDVEARARGLGRAIADKITAYAIQ